MGMQAADVGKMNVCQRNECQTTAGCAYRGPRGEYCYFAGRFVQPSNIPAQGCVCPYCLGTGKVLKWDDGIAFDPAGRSRG